MATQTFTKTFDDIDKSEGAETHSFSLDGKAYTIDLNAKNLGKLVAALTPFIEAGSRITGATATRSTATVTGAPKAKDGPAASDVRAWAEANGITYNGKPVKASDKGRVAAEIIEKYVAAQA